MKRRFLVCATLLAVAFFGAAQEATLPTINDLTPPSNPALALMGYQPTEIVKPKTLRQLETTLVNSMQGANGFSVPTNFGLEVLPYYLRANPQDVYAPGKFKKNESEPLKYLALSLGSVNETNGDSTKMNLGFGLRTQLLSGRLSESTLHKMDSVIQLYNKQAQPQDYLNNAVGSLFGETDITYSKALEIIQSSLVRSLGDAAATSAMLDIQKALKVVVPSANLTSNIDDVEAFMSAMQDELKKAYSSEALTALVTELQQLQLRTYGLVWELATATYLDFPTGDIGYSLVPKWALWTQLGWKCENRPIDVLGIVRYMRDYSTAFNSGNLDLGVSVSGTIDRLSFGGEFVQRYQAMDFSSIQSEDQLVSYSGTIRFDYRATLQATYKLSDKAVITYSFGKTFDFTEQTDNNLVSQLSVNFGFGAVPISLGK